jgi:hypothetical protein
MAHDYACSQQAVAITLLQVLIVVSRAISVLKYRLRAAAGLGR